MAVFRLVRVQVPVRHASFLFISRHCERSEAIQSHIMEGLDCFGAAPLAVTGKILPPSFRGGPKDRTRNLEIPGLRFARSVMTKPNRGTVRGPECPGILACGFAATKPGQHEIDHLVDRRARLRLALGLGDQLRMK